jgi:hypothetical protein
VGARRWPASAAAAAWFRRRQALGPDNKRIVAVLRGLGKGHGWLGALEKDGGGECRCFRPATYQGEYPR